MTLPARRFALGRPRRQPGTMNKTESRYAQMLELRKKAGEILEFYFEAVTLKLAHDCRFTPDFMTLMADCTIEFHEVKGFWREDARVKIRVAANTFPFFRFLAVRSIKDEWITEEFR